MNNVITNTTNRTQIHTYEAIQKIKYKLINHEKKSTQLYHREDPVFSPVDPSLCYHMQTAARRMKSSVKAPVRKRIPKKTSVSTVHKKASEARAAIENNAESSVITSKPDDMTHVQRRGRIQMMCSTPLQQQRRSPAMTSGLSSRSNPERLLCQPFLKLQTSC